MFIIWNLIAFFLFEYSLLITKFTRKMEKILEKEDLSISFRKTQEQTP